MINNINQTNTLRSFIEKTNPLSQACARELDAMLISKPVAKDDIFILEGSRVNTELFLAKGIVRAYLVDDQGNEKCTAFYQAESFLGTSKMRSKHGYSLYTFQALTDVVMYAVDSDKFIILINTYPELMKAVKQVKEVELERLSNRENCLLQASATEKYTRFLQYHKNLLQEIPHYHIASYLGITPITLSRIRGINKKN